VLAESLRADLLVNGLGAAGALGHLSTLARRRAKSPLERRVLFLVGLLATMLVVREVSWAVPPVAWLEALELLPATLLPLALALFTEGLLRRHLPRVVKVAVLLISAVALTADLAGRLATDPILSVAFPVALLLVMLVLALFVAFRDRDSLSRAENRLCTAALAVGLLNVPLALSDFRPVFGFSTTRMGAIGVLALCHLLSRGGSALASGRAVLGFLVKIATWALIASAALLALLGRWSAAELSLTLPVALALVLTLNLFEHLRAQERSTRAQVFLRWLARDESPDLPAFLDALPRCPGLDDPLVVGEAELAAYDREEMLSRLRRLGHDCTLARLRREASRGGERTLGPAEQLVDLLERYQMTQAVLLSERPLRLLLVHSTGLADPDSLLELRLIARRARALARLGPAHA